MRQETVHWTEEEIEQLITFLKKCKTLDFSGASERIGKTEKQCQMKYYYLKRTGIFELNTKKLK